jgi:hypothetical protein
MTDFVDRLRDASEYAEGAEKLIANAADKLDAVISMRNGYASQAKFADIDSAVHFREFVRRIDAALAA